MLFFIKFLYQWILPPACIFLLLLGLNIYMYQNKAKGRSFLSLVLILLYIFSIRMGANILVWPLENWYGQPQQVSGDVILMLGNGAHSDVPDIDGVGQPSGTMGKNMLLTLRLQKMTELPILISGGTVFQDSGSESEIAYREFLGMGIPSEKIFIENRSRNTVENAKYSKEKCNENGWKHPILTVVALQAPRSAMIFKREGLDCTVYPTHYRQNRTWHFNPIMDLVPNAEHIDNSAAAIREYMGILAFKLYLQ
jgi:uncharacterized SAM-binding protein YcdF (DUF218 family)